MASVYTFGYAGKSLVATKELLDDRFGDDYVVVDVRIKPWSKVNDWTKRRLASVFGPTHYTHVRTFGNVNYRGGPIQIVDMKAGAAWVRQRIDRQPGVALIFMCMEKNPVGCHRVTIAAHVAAYLDVEYYGEVDARSPDRTAAAQQAKLI